MPLWLALIALTAFVIVLFGICAFICGGRSEPLDLGGSTDAMRGED